MGFIRFRTVSTVLLCALLLALFWFPQRLVIRAAKDWNDQIEHAATALTTGDFSTAKAHCDALLASATEREPALERFLNHDTVDAVLAALKEAQVLTEVRDVPGALAALTAAKGAIAYAESIERFAWNDLL